MPENLERVVSDEVQKLEQEKIPPIVAVSPDLEDYENDKVVLSFEPYNQNHCEISLLQKQDAKHFTNELKKMTTTLRKHFLHQSTSRIACKPIQNSPRYAPLFQGLPKDADLLEVDYTGTGRIFGYLTRNVFNVVSVKVRHI